MTEVEYWIRQPDGSVQGPFPLARIQGWVEAGRVRPEMEFSTDNASWVRGSRMPDLFLPPPPGTRPPPPPPSSGTAAPTPMPVRRSPKRSPAPARESRGGRAARSVGQRGERKRVLRQAVLPFAVVTVALGAVAAVCAFLPWTTIDDLSDLGLDVAVDGIDSNTGRLLIVLALGGSVAALLALAGQSGRVTMLVAALALGGAAAFNAVRIGSTEELRESGATQVIYLLALDPDTSTLPARYVALAACVVGALVAAIGAAKTTSVERAFDRAQRE